MITLPVEKIEDFVIGLEIERVDDDSDDEQRQLFTIDGGRSTVSYSVVGLPAGSYRLTAYGDTNGDGDVTDAIDMETQLPDFGLSNGATSDRPITLTEPSVSDG